MSKSKSIFSKLKATQSFEAQNCPILIHGESGSDGNNRFKFLLIFFVALHMVSDRITNLRNKKTQLIMNSLKITAVNKIQ